MDGTRESTLTVVAVYPYHTGNGNCFHFDTAVGDRVVWFSKRKQKLALGDTLRAEFVVYKHEMHNGVAQNLVRCFHRKD
jgi:hypothetical protein